MIATVKTDGLLHFDHDFKLGAQRYLTAKVKSKALPTAVLIFVINTFTGPERMDEYKVFGRLGDDAPNIINRYYQTSEIKSLSPCVNVIVFSDK